MLQLGMTVQIPEDARDALNGLVQRLSSVLGDNLIGVYLHGSLAMGTFNPVSSDIDVLVVAKDELGTQTKALLQRDMQLLSKNAPAKGFEMSVIVLDALTHFKYPTPYDFHFHYSDAPVSPHSEGGKSYDHDLAAHFVTVKERGITLYGEPIKAIFPEVSRCDYLRSIAHDAEWSFHNTQRGADYGTCSVPVYTVLNFCRALAFIKDGLIRSKREGGEWGIDNLPAQYRPLILEALKEYAESGTAEEVDAVCLKELSSYSWAAIQSARDALKALQQG